jgi:hypothetical protein
MPFAWPVYCAEPIWTFGLGVVAGEGKAAHMRSALQRRTVGNTVPKIGGAMSYKVV